MKTQYFTPTNFTPPIVKLCLFLLALLLPTGEAAAQHIAFTDVNVIDVRNGLLLPGQTVLVEGNRIATVGPAGEVAVPSDAEVVEAGGKYLIPGLWDMHVHGTRWESTYPLYLANGVTGVREMFGPTDAKAFRSALADKQLAAPRIHLAAPIIDGAPPIWSHSVSVSTAEEARQAVIDQKQHGIDFINQGPPPIDMSGGGGVASISTDREAFFDVDLEAGDYALLCFVTAPDGQTHVAHGMYQHIRVQ